MSQIIHPADRQIQVRIGVPKATGAVFAAAPGPILLSAGALWDPGTERFRAPPAALWGRDVALDSGGFVAMMMHGGYRWSVAQYVELVVRGRSLAARAGEEDADIGGLGAPWSWWSAMDYCCEPEIAKDRREVERRMALTVERYVDCLNELGRWREEGDTQTPDPMPILQGRTPDDYVRSAAALAQAIDDAHPCSCPCPSGDPDCAAPWHRTHAGLPEIVGVGSVCRRSLRGDDGILRVVGALDQALPAHVRLHLFGVKSSALAALAGHPRIASVDSQAWGTAARTQAVQTGTACTNAMKIESMTHWAASQRAAARPTQLPLF